MKYQLLKPLERQINNTVKTLPVGTQLDLDDIQGAFYQEEGIARPVFDSVVSASASIERAGIVQPPGGEGADSPADEDPDPETDTQVSGEDDPPAPEGFDPDAALANDPAPEADPDPEPEKDQPQPRGRRQKAT